MNQPCTLLSSLNKTKQKQQKQHNLDVISGVAILDGATKMAFWASIH